MPTWRDRASPQAQNDLDGLLEPTISFAQQQLDKHGEFFPFAVVLRADGKTEMVAADPDTNVRPASRDLVDECRSTCFARRDQLRAAAVVVDVRIPYSGDAIQVDLEHTEGPALTLLLPYSEKRFGRGINYGQLQAGAGTRHIWFA